ncbi:restriction endonuclease subunit S [Leuconostoc lactis]|uniref:restriction endonuclease subunit S n=1 Tax=Leuconostoc lactis TaxID=1246 RepID=UPI000219457E|nr:restriction endonuclease subunit S [Leuconostoc lactis]GHC20671.1 putative type I site-specific deoxyribonuclease [Leuconostoc lactis KCTC 3528 = DSM 20202]
MSEMVPKVRFSSFTDDWEERKLGDEVRIVMGQSPNSENYTDDPNDYILVQGNADMKNGRVFPRVWTTQVTKQAEKDDLILSVRAPVGDIGKTAYDVVIGRGVAAIKGNEFIFQNLGKMKSDGYWTRYSTGSTFESINSTDIKEAIISVPAIEEQNKIGSFFKQLDNTIALHQRKLDLLKEQKKGFLQKMFPKNGSRVPELRFSGFADDWEQRKLKDIANYRNGKAHEQVEDIDGQFTIVNSKFISTNGNVQRHTYKQVEPLFKGEITFVLSDLPNGKALAKVFRIDEDNKYTLNQRIAGITPKKGTDSIFLSYILNRNSYFLKFDSGVSQTNLSRSQVEGFTSTLPCFEEQTEIGSFFKQLDNLITLHQRKLDLLKEQKKGFLQKMFVS